MNRFVLLALLFALFLCNAWPLRAQDKDTNADAMRAVPLAAGERIVLDGSLSHPAWQRAPVFGRFIEKDPVQGAVPPQRTQVQVLFDERALYVGITAFETQPERIRDVLVRADGVNRTQDFVLVYIDAIGSKQSAQFFRVNAAGSTADGLHTASDDSEDFAPDFDWDAAVQRNPQGWTAVLRLPFASLRFAEGRHDWRVMVARRLPREQFHLVLSVPLPRDAPSFIDRLQPLQGVVLPEKHQFLTLRPSVTLRTQREDGNERGNDVDASLDVKWRPRAELVIDGTVNPDFSQVALDVPQLAGNSRFALFFPEKRPFFFESADLLRTPTEAFYTRSVTAPRWGLRATWRGPVWAGSSFVVDDRGGGLVLLPGPYGTDFADQPAHRSLGARAKADQGALQFGGLLAARRYADGVGENTVAGPDLGWQIDDAWRLRAQWLHSQTSAFTEGRSIDGDRVYAKLWRLTDDSEFSLEADDTGRDFRHHGGFVNQVGVRKLTAFGSRGWHGVSVFNAFYVNLQLQHVRDTATGQAVLQDVRPGLWGTAARNLEWWFELHPRSLVRTAPNQPLLHERYVETGLVMTPASWFPLLETELAVGRLADTVDNQVRPGIRGTVTTRLRPFKRLEFEPSLSLAWLKDGGDGGDGGRMVYRESAAQWLAVWHFDARNNLRAIVQRGSLNRSASAAGSGVRDGSTEASLTYTWRQSAGTLLYVGASRSRVGVEGPRRTTEAFVKLQVDVDEVRAAVGRM